MPGPRSSFTIPQLDKPTYRALQDLRTVHAASQWEIISAAILLFAQAPVRDRAAALRVVRTAPSEQPDVVVQPSS